jgi:hypothetical protein
MEMIKKVRAKIDRDRTTFCNFCISKATKHTKDCPTKLEGFDKETAHALTEEEREKLIQEKIINK